MIRLVVILVFLGMSISAFPETIRSKKSAAEFKHQQPCPATGAERGRCPGYEIDHRVPLKCGCPDHPSNMQWLTKDEHKAKTAREAKFCHTSKR